jgi:hypothetical protein
VIALHVDDAWRTLPGKRTLKVVAAEQACEERVDGCLVGRKYRTGRWREKLKTLVVDSDTHLAFLLPPNKILFSFNLQCGVCAAMRREDRIKSCQCK